MSRRAYPTDSDNVLSSSNNPATGVPSGVVGTTPIMYQSPQQQQQQQTPNMMMNNQTSPSFVPQQQQQQQQQQQTPPPTGIAGDPVMHHGTSKRVYPVDPNNETLVTSNFASMNLGGGVQQQQHQQPIQHMQVPTYQQPNGTPQQQQQQVPPPSSYQYQQQQQQVPLQQTPHSPLQQQQQQQVPLQQTPQSPPTHLSSPVYQQQQQQQIPPQQPNQFSPPQSQSNQYIPTQPHYQQPQPQQQQHQQNQYPTQPQQQQQYQQFIPQPTTNYQQPNYPQPQQTQQQPAPYSQPQSQHPSFIPEPPVPTAENTCPKTFMRLSLNAVPNIPSTLSKVHIPFGCQIHPLAVDPNYETPIVSTKIIRCKRCHAYINPFVIFIDGGARWKCNVCDFINDTPFDYLNTVDSTTGKRIELNQKPELLKGCIEFMATGEYSHYFRSPQAPTYFFVIDVCYESIVSGMLNTAIEAIRASLDKLPDDNRTKFGIMTFDDSLHFFNLKSNSGRPQMYVVTEMDTEFVPPFEDFVVPLRDNRTVINNTLDIIQKMERKTQKVESCLGTALKAAFSICQMIGGKIIVLQSYLPRGPVGKLSIRDYQSVLGTKKEVSLLQGTNEAEFYKGIALNCSDRYLSIDLHLFSNDYTDTASLSCLPQITAGEMFYYPSFIEQRDGPVFYGNLVHSLTRNTGWEAYMRVRCSRGVSTTAYHGNYFLKKSDLLELPTVDSDKTFTLQFGITDTITSKYISIQSALLYTHSCGERRVRVLTTCVPVVQSISDVFKYADIGVVTSLISKMAVEKALSSSLNDARDAIANKCVDILTAFKTTHANTNQDNLVKLSSAAPRLLLPESLKHLPLYVVAMVKNIVFSSRLTNPDIRAFHMHRIKSLNLGSCLTFFYPFLYSIIKPTPLDRPVESINNLPPTQKLSASEISRTGISLLVNGYTQYIFVGEAVDPTTHFEIFGCTFDQLDSNNFRQLPQLDNDNSKYTRKMIELAQMIFSQPMNTVLVKSSDKVKRDQFQSLLIEDKLQEGISYFDFIIHLHQRTQ
eukprot:gene12348-15091_t